MRDTSIIIFMLTVATIGAAVPSGAPEIGFEDRQDSGCFPFEDPHCCINYAVCQCANGWFYQFNQAENTCNPPIRLESFSTCLAAYVSTTKFLCLPTLPAKWGIIGTDVSAVPGFYY